MFFVDAQACAKAVKDKTDAQTKAVKKIQSCLETGDLNALPKLYATLRDASIEREDALGQLESLTQGFNGQEYMANGEYASQMLDYCRELKVDVHGSFPIYEMFPCRVTVNPESQDVTVDKKRMQCLRPVKLISSIKSTLDKLSKAQFNAQVFAKELSAAYDLALIKSSRKKTYVPDAPVYVRDLYDFLTPMRRYKREYTMLNYAYDLARLYAEDDLVLDDGRKIRYDTVRDARRAVRILDKNGAEQYITTVRFY